jgi:ATP-dependent Clp protease ATP-binding subunit ClpA
MSGVPLHWAFMSRCTMEARRVLWHAVNAVHEFGGPAITPEHLLLGLMEEDVRASEQLAALPIAKKDLRREVAALLAGATVPAAVDVPLSEAALQLVNAASAEAERLGHGRIASTHLLLGLLAAPATPSARVLQSHGLTAERIRAGMKGTDPDSDDA